MTKVTSLQKNKDLIEEARDAAIALFEEMTGMKSTTWSMSGRGKDFRMALKFEITSGAVAKASKKIGCSTAASMFFERCSSEMFKLDEQYGNVVGDMIRNSEIFTNRGHQYRVVDCNVRSLKYPFVLENVKTGKKTHAEINWLENLITKSLKSGAPKKPVKKTPKVDPETVTVHREVERNKEKALDAFAKTKGAKPEYVEWLRTKTFKNDKGGEFELVEYNSRNRKYKFVILNVKTDEQVECDEIFVREYTRRTMEKAGALKSVHPNDKGFKKNLAELEGRNAITNKLTEKGATAARADKLARSEFKKEGEFYRIVNTLPRARVNCFVVVNTKTRKEKKVSIDFFKGVRLVK